MNLADWELTVDKRIQQISENGNDIHVFAVDGVGSIIYYDGCLLQ